MYILIQCSGDYRMIEVPNFPRAYLQNAVCLFWKNIFFHDLSQLLLFAVKSTISEVTPLKNMTQKHRSTSLTVVHIKATWDINPKAFTSIYRECPHPFVSCSLRNKLFNFKIFWTCVPLEKITRLRFTLVLFQNYYKVLSQIQRLLILNYQKYFWTPAQLTNLHFLGK